MKSDHIIFMGSPEFSVPTLKSLLEQFPNSKVTIITQIDKAKGRKGTPQATAVKSFALEEILTVYTPKNEHELEEITMKLNPDLIIVIAFGMILPKSITSSFFCINTHASILPQYRGASPIHSSLLNGDSKTGISLIRMDEGMDTGDILTISEEEIKASDNLETLSQRLADLGATALCQFIKEEYLNNSYTEKKQNDNDASYCYKLTTKDMELKLNESTETWVNKIRAFAPKPGAYIIHNSKRIKILSASIVNTKLKIDTVKPEGKKVMTYKDFCLGNPEGIPIPC